MACKLEDCIRCATRAKIDVTVETKGVILEKNPVT